MADLNRVRLNIFSAAHDCVRDWGALRPDADQPNSSQAFCISVWGTAASRQGAAVRAAIGRQLGDSVMQKIAQLDPPQLQVIPEFVAEELLGEQGLGRPTNVDALVLAPGLGVVVESKLHERLGPCGQVTQRDCSGTYGPGSDLKTNTTAWCRLDVADGLRKPRLYWSVMRALSRDEMYPAGQPCAFAGLGYQVMRNIAFAAAYAELKGHADWRTIFAFPFDEENSEAIERVVARLKEENQRRVLRLNYRTLAETLSAVEDETARGLAVYMKARL